MAKKKVGAASIVDIDARLRFGVCYYPDQWPESRWREDFALMRDAGIECIRWLEGSWTLVEPSEGVYDFSVVDRVLDLAAEYGLGVILGTPTYAVPAWMIERYPNVIARRADGQPWYHLSRRCWDYTDADYRRCCNGVVKALAKRYANDSRVWAWQIDNEMWCHLGELWGPGVEHAFQAWCEKRYGNIESLNAAWGLAFWSRQMENFTQIPLPGPTPAHLNHHQVADYNRFLSDLALGFLGEQIDAIKKANKSALVLHNCPFEPLDRKALLGQLDAYGHDHYPAFAGAAKNRPAMGLNYGRFRPHARRLWVVEQQASQVGQTSYRLPLAPPGEIGVTALQSIGHGCNLLAWFRWRTYPCAQETNWGGLLPHWGEPGRHYREAAELIRVLAPHAEALAATSPMVSVARICSFEQSLAHRVEPWIAERLGSPECGRATLVSLGLNEDCIEVGQLSNRYQVALIPHAVALDATAVAQLQDFVHSGGVLVVGPLAGHRDGQFHGPNQRPPGALGGLTGTGNPEATTWDGELNIHGISGGGLTAAGQWAEIIEPIADEVKVRARYASGWIAGNSAICERRVGSGRVIHCGVALCDAVLAWLWNELQLPIPDQTLRVFSPAAEVLSREGNGLRYHFALNHGEGPAVFQVRRPLVDASTQAAVRGPFTLEARRWRILIEHLQPTEPAE